MEDASAIYWIVFIPVLIIGLIVCVRWLYGLQRRANDHGERISRIEGRLEDHGPREPPPL